jgi:DNA-directed RNA polymerase specialized sigma24 family protein
MDDVTLVRQAQAGQTDAYDQLVQRWATRVYALCQGVCGRVDLAGQLAEETFARGLDDLAALVDPGRFGPWLADIATRTCREKGRPGAAAAAEPDDPLLRAILALPEEERTVLLLCGCQRTSYREVAALLGVSAATVNTRLAQARLHLRAALPVAGPGQP